MPVRSVKIFFYILCITFCGLTVSSHATIQYTYDQNGNLISGDGKYYEYNDANKLVRVRHQNSTGPVIAEYVYDHSGQRIKKIEDGVTTYYVGKHFETQKGSAGTTETKYYFANQTRVAKKDPDGNLTFYHADHLGGTNAITDTSGNLIERIRYYPFGDIRSGGTEQYTYTGKEKDNTTDFYYYEARYYGVGSRHFIQTDITISNYYDPQDLNKYTYVQNNPIRFNDPTGNTLKEQIGRFGAAISNSVNHVIAPLQKQFWQEWKELHYDRNRYNQSVDYETAIAKWDGSVSANCHQQNLGNNTGNENNQKFVSPDGGHSEAIFDKNNKPVTDPLNGPSYNFENPKTYDHLEIDWFPWIIFGNSPDDPSAWHDRLKNSVKIDNEIGKAFIFYPSTFPFYPSTSLDGSAGTAL